MKRLLFVLLCIVLLCSSGCTAGQKEATGDAAAVSGFSKAGSQGLEYELGLDGMVTVTGLGECQDLWIVIPDVIDGCPVTQIAENAFYCQTTLRGVKLGANVLTIGDYAFFGCSALESLELNDHLNTIGKYAFSGCRLLTKISIPSRMKSIDAWAFFECSGLTAVHIEALDFWYQIRFGGIYANPLMLAGTLYVAGEPLTEFVLPEDLTQIGEWTFAGCQSLTTVQLHGNITAIGQRAFLDCENLSAIVYDGTAEQWRQVILGTYWDFSMKYEIQCLDKVMKG